jgi:nifR3 family TIM-barrel protein
MENVTDFAFREVVADIAPPHIFFTEFTSADGLCSEGKIELLEKLKYSEKQRPIVAQIWGTNPKNMHEAAKLVSSLGFDGVDINMGCPDRSVMKQGSGAAHCLDQKATSRIIQSVKKGSSIPVSVKTRIGYNRVITNEWIPFLLEQDITALIIHGRTAKNMSDVPADWDEIGKAVRMRDEIAKETLIIGNGDIKSLEDAKKMHKAYFVDGVMIARGIFENPWIFDDSDIEHRKEEYLLLAIKHLKSFEETYGERGHFDAMKKFFKMYIREFNGANRLRQKLMDCKKAESARKLIVEELNKERVSLN